MANKPIDIILPDLGGAKDCEVIEIPISQGQTIAIDDTLIILETDKASMEIPATHNGIITDIKVKEGSLVNEGDLIVQISTTANETVDTSATSVSTDHESDDQAPPSNKQNADTHSSESPPATTTTNDNSQPDQDNNQTTENISVEVPDLGGAKDAAIIEIVAQPGAQLAIDDTLIVLETDKASMEIPAPVAGKLVSLAVKEGQTVNTGDLIATVSGLLQEASAKTAVEESTTKVSSHVTAPTPSQAPSQAPSQETPEISSPAIQTSRNQPATQPSIDNQASVHAGPAVRMLARELGVDLHNVGATGPKQRILKEDIHNYVKQQLTKPSTMGGAIEKPPAIDFSQYGQVEKIAMSKIHKLTAHNMTLSLLNVPQVTQFDQADITEMEAFRKSMKAQAQARNSKLTPLPFIIKACALALQALPQFNVSLDNDGQHIIQKHYLNIGIAVDTPHGLTVPVIRDAANLSIWQLADAVIALSNKAKNKQLTLKDMEGGCFTISSLGSIGGTAFTPIVNTPEVAILGVSKAMVQPVFNGEEFVPKLMLPLSLSYDHRAINGADAARFTSHLGQLLGDIRTMLME